MTSPSDPQRRLTGRLRVALPPDEAFFLFTPRGEQDWAPGWTPYFPVPVTDDTEPGTVFETHAHGQTATWVVVDRAWGQRVRYARVIPHLHAGTITVALDAANGHTDVTVTYELTALSEDGEQHLREFAAGYRAFIQSWQDAIAALPRKERDAAGGEGEDSC